MRSTQVNTVKLKFWNVGSPNGTNKREYRHRDTEGGTIELEKLARPILLTLGSIFYWMLWL